MTVGERDRALSALNADLAALVVIEITAKVAAEARGLLLRHPLRASDSVQLASCLYLRRELSQPLPLVTFDDRLAAAARAEGLSVLPA